MANKKPVIATIGFAAISAFCCWYMRIRTVVEGFPINFNEDVFEKNRLSDGSQLRAQYTHVAPADSLLKMLVAAFVPGSAGGFPAFQVQQIYFLAQFSAVVTVMTVESHRVRNQGRWIRFVGTCAALYQCLGAAIILPIYCAMFIWASAKDGYYSSGAAVHQANLLLPALVLGYVVPTVLMFVPWGDLELSQLFAAFWQPAPLFPNLLAYLFSAVGGKVATSKASSDAANLKKLYILSGVLSVASHVGLVYVSLTSADPALSISSVLLPREADRLKDTAHGLMWIFQWDFLGTFSAVLLWSWVSMVEIWRVSSKEPAGLLGDALWVGLITLLGGPGAAVSAVWFWREGKMALLVNGGKTKGT